MSVPVPEYGGCPWPTAPSCLTEEWLAADGPIRDRALALASSTLERLTAYRVTNCPVTVRPCGTSRCGAAGWSLWASGVSPLLYAGRWYNTCVGACGCRTSCEVPLPAPVGRVDEVRVNGDVIDPADYRVDGNLLVWQGSTDCPFPPHQDLSLPDGADGTFSVTYLNGYPVDELGAQAVTFLALEFLKACKPKGKCSLPRGVTDVVRNGISFTIEAGLFPNGLTSIEIVDAYIEMWRPQGSPTRPSRVWSPDLNRTRIVR